VQCGVIYAADNRIGMKHYRFMSDVTLSTISHKDAPCDGDGLVADELVVLAECDRPLAGSSLHRLHGVDELVIGRGARREVDRTGARVALRIGDARISTVHATLRRVGSAFTLVDEHSKNGILVNGRRVERHLLRDGDLFECGRTFFLYRMACARPRDEPLDLDYGEARAATDALATLHEPLAAQFRALVEVARTPIPVLILGPSGTGKELVARAIHGLSRRRGAFVGVNCGALPDSLVEGELFGARRGAFTGASEDRAGLVRASDQGTLFLDEIGDLSLRAQPALLRVLQEREVLAVGATRPLAVDLRVVAATHRDLDEQVRQEHFRADLLARLSGFVIRLPTLRARLEDFGLLTATLMARHALHPKPTISAEAMRLLLNHPWPLNVRELEHCLRAALALSPSRIEVAHLPSTIRDPDAATPAVPRVASRPVSTRRLTDEQLARRAELLARLTAHAGNISAVARELGKDRVQIRRWIRQYGIALEELVG
jgi:DNA-binding NtrC family response regulator